MAALTNVLTTIQNAVSALNNIGQLITQGTFNSSSLRVQLGGTIGSSLITGTSTNDNAAAGFIGEYITSVVSSASAVAYASGNVTFNITSINISAGDWDIGGAAAALPSGATDVLLGWISSQNGTLTATIDVLPYLGLIEATFVSGTRQGIPVPIRRWSVANSTTVYLNAEFGASSGLGYGNIWARRAR